MFVESIEFKREFGSDWEEGYYIGDTDNSKKSTVLDKNYTPLERDSFGCLRVWDYRTNTQSRVQLRVNG